MSPFASIRVGVLVSWVGLAGACSAAGSPERSAELGVGKPLPGVDLSGERPALVWVIGVEQCLGCELGEPAWTVRTLQRRLGETIETVVVAVGEGRAEETKLVTDFLASQRVTARVEVRTVKQYLRDFGSAALSTFYVVNRSAVIEAALSADSAQSWRSSDGRRDFHDLVEMIANKGEATGEGPVMQE